MSNNNLNEKLNVSFTFFTLTMMLFAGAAIKNFLSSPLKMPWSIVMFVGSIVTFFYFLKNISQTTYTIVFKATNIMVFLIILFFMSDLVFVYPFFQDIRKYWSHPAFILAMALIYTLILKITRREETPVDETVENSEKTEE